MVNLMLGMGYAGLNLKLEIIKKILRTLPLAVAVFGGYENVSLGNDFSWNNSTNNKHVYGK